MARTWLSAAVTALMLLALPGLSPAFFGGSKDKGILKKKERAAAIEVFSGMESEVRLLFFNTTEECKKCGDIGRLLKELSEMSGYVDHEVLDLEEDSSRAAELGVVRAPAIVMLGGGGRDYGIRYYGLPLGYEFDSFLEAVLNTARGTTGLSPQTEEGLKLVTKPVTISVFVARH